MKIHRVKICMQDDCVSDCLSTMMPLRSGLIFLLFIAFGAIVPDLIADSDVFKISSDTFSIGETWVYRDSAYYSRSELGGIVGKGYITKVYHNTRIIDKLTDRDSSFYICEMVDSGIINYSNWDFLDTPNIDTAYDSIVYKKEIDTLYLSPFYQSFLSGVYSSDSIVVHKCIYMNDTLYLNEQYHYLEKYGFFRYESVFFTNTIYSTESRDLISHNGILFDTSAILPINLNNRNILKSTSPYKNAATISFSSNYLIINDAEHDSKIYQNGYALYSIDGRLLQKGVYKNNVEITLNFIGVPRSLVVKLGTGSVFSVIRRNR
jgi:hypothetical protein